MSCMSERFIIPRHRTGCYHCREGTGRIIKVTFAQAQVTCSACGATRRLISLFEGAGTVEICTPLRRHDI